MIEIIDRVLQLLEDAFLLLPILGHVGDAPQGGEAAGGARHGPHGDAVPGEIARAVERGSHADLLAGGAPFAGGLGEAVDRLGHVGSAREGALHGAQIGQRPRARETEISVVGINDAAVVLDHREPLAGGVGDRLGEIVAGPLPAELDGPDGEGEDEEHAGHGEDGKQPEDQRLRLVVGDDAQADRRSDEQSREEQEEADMPRLVRPTRRGRRRRFGHVRHRRQLSFPFRLRTRAA